MAKSGKARVITSEQQNDVIDMLMSRRHSEKNIAIMQVSFKLGLRVQEIALLQIKEVARLKPYSKALQRDFTLRDVMSLPAAYTKGANTIKRSNARYLENRTMTFKKTEFDRIVNHIVQLAKAGAMINPADFYPELRQHKGKSRDLPMVDRALREALTEYLALRLEKDPSAKLADPLFLSQKGGSYSPNSLQQHMGKILKQWAGIEKASSHSGRRSLATDIIHNQEKPLSIAQEVLGHVNPATTIIYAQPTDEQIGEALNDVYKK